MLMNRLFQGIGGFQNALTVGPTPASQGMGQGLGGMPSQGMGQGLGGMPGQSQPLQQYGQYLEKTYDNFDGKRNAFLSNVREQEQNTFGQSQSPQNQFTGLESQQPYNRDQFNANNIGQLGDSQPLEAFKSFFNQGGEVPRQTEIMGQPHRLAYVNPQEEQMMLDAGGAGTPGPGGIPAYWLLTEPSTWGDGAGYEGMGNFNASDNDSNPTANDDDNNTQTMTIGEYTDSLYAPGSNSNQTSNDNVGFIDSIAMGTGFKDKSPAYYSATANSIASSQGQEAAQNYLNNNVENGNILANNLGMFSESASQVPFNPPFSSNDDNNNVVDSVNETVDDGTVGDGTVGDGVEEEIQYTQMKPFYGGYQPSTRAETLIPSQRRTSMSPDPRLDPIYPQQPPPDYFIDDGPEFGKTFPPGYDGSPVPFETLNPLTGQPQTAPINNGGQFSSLAELDAFQQQYPSANLMTEYQRLRALEGGIPAVAQLPPRGVASMFGNEQAPQYMYQGIMG